MSRQFFADQPYNDVPIADLTAVTATVETGLWNVPQFSPIPANDARAAKVYEIIASGVYSTGASGTLTLTPRFGTTTGGISFGASVAQAVPVSLTNEAWAFHGFMTIRTVGVAGANSTATFVGTFNGGGAAATAGSSCVVVCGGTPATVDLSVAGGLFLGWTLSVAGSVTPKQVIWASRN